MVSAVSRQLIRKFSSTSCVVMVLAASVLLSACQTKTAGLGGDDLTTASTTAVDEGQVSFTKTGELSKQWEKDKSNPAIGLAYASNLEKLGQKPQQLQVLKEVSDGHVGKADVQARVGKMLLVAGQAADAVTPLERAVAANPQDWQSLSALGSAYDQMSRHAEAREKYQMALAIKPDAVAVRNNLAMSYAVQGQLPEAEKLLRELMGAKGPSANRVRQNLALVVGLQGRFDEARQIASQDLPKEQVDANLAYLQQMLAQPNTWKQLQENG